MDTDIGGATNRNQRVTGHLGGGPWVQHGGSGASGLPYAEHLVETVPRRERLRGADGPRGGGDWLQPTGRRSVGATQGPDQILRLLKENEGTEEELLAFRLYKAIYKYNVI